VACGDAAYRAARVALQVHGAIGYTEEHDVSLWLTKIRALLPGWGTQAEHRARVLEALLRAARLDSEAGCHISSCNHTRSMLLEAAHDHEGFLVCADYRSFVIMVAPLAGGA
jgi:acyl-CoA dehydrogenase-like protein